MNSVDEANDQEKPDSRTMNNGETEQEVSANLNNFISTGRTGRRNAVPDLVEDGSAKVTTAGLSTQLQKLTCN